MVSSIAPADRDFGARRKCLRQARASRPGCCRRRCRLEAGDWSWSRDRRRRTSTARILLNSGVRAFAEQHGLGPHPDHHRAPGRERCRARARAPNGVSTSTHAAGGARRPCRADAGRLADEFEHEQALRRAIDLARASPRCSMRPSFITAMRSLITSASSWSWVTKIEVMPRSRSRRRSSICMVSRSLRSSALNGSSSSSSAGFTAIARATAMRCCWPPESAGDAAVGEIAPSAPARAPRATRVAISAFGDRAAPAGRRRHSRRRSDAETARSSGTPRRCCACARQRASGRGPPTEMVPVRASSRPAMMRSSVVLPQPDGPSSETNSPRLTAMLSSLQHHASSRNASRRERRRHALCPAIARPSVRPVSGPAFIAPRSPSRSARSRPRGCR